MVQAGGVELRGQVGRRFKQLVETRAAGVELSPTTSAEFGRFIASETVKWADVIKRSGTKLD